MGTTQSFTSRQTSGMSALISAFLVMLMTSAFGVSAGASFNGTLLRFDNLTSAIDTISEYAAYDPDTTNYLLSIDDEIIGISNFTIDPIPNNTKRWDGSNAPLGASWTQYQTAQQGTWWTIWYPASCVHQNELGGAPITISVSQSMTYTATWSAGFELSYAEAASANIGFEITQTNTKTESNTYTVPAYDDGQVYQQQLVVWQDQQNQHCHKYHYGSGGIKCGAWSEYIRGNIPVKNGESFGWSTGHDRMDFSSCGGGN